MGQESWVEKARIRTSALTSILQTKRPWAISAHGLFYDRSTDHLERNDLDHAPFDAQGGLGNVHQLFGDQMGALNGGLNG